MIVSWQFRGTWDVNGIREGWLGRISPNLNAYVERWIQSMQQECLDHVVVFGEEHLRYLLTEYLVHYHAKRPHQAKGNVPRSCGAPVAAEGRAVACRARLGGLLRHFYRKAG